MFIYDLLVRFADWVWGAPMVIFLVGGGILLTIINNGVQFRRAGYIAKTAFKMLREGPKEEGKVSGMQALMAALSATIGTGNIIGVSLAIAWGGPGAVFWMWVCGFVAMGIKYSEILASVKYREPRENGEYSAGPYMYIKKGLKNKFIAKILSVAFVISLICGLLLAAAVHTGAISDTISAFNVPRTLISIVCMIAVVLVVYGGVQSLVKVTDKMVPIMSTLYILGALVVVGLNINNLIPSLKLIFGYAFKPAAAMGGFAGTTVALTVRWGLARGMYSSDSGNGIQAIMHGQAHVDHPVEQAILGVVEVFFDTIVICSLTALAVLTSGVWMKYSIEDGGSFALKAFSETLGLPGTIIITVTVALFALSTIISFAYFVENQTSYFVGKAGGKVPARVRQRHLQDHLRGSDNKPGAEVQGDNLRRCQAGY